MRRAGVVGACALALASLASSALAQTTTLPDTTTTVASTTTTISYSDLVTSFGQDASSGLRLVVVLLVVIAITCFLILLGGKS